jgi:hypothetical protein
MADDCEGNRKMDVFFFFFLVAKASSNESDESVSRDADVRSKTIQ